LNALNTKVKELLINAKKKNILLRARTVEYFLILSKAGLR